MPRRPRKDAPGLTHHVWSRGINKEIIFFDDHDRAKFLAILEVVLADAGAYLVTWVLLGNHFHLVICVGESVLLAAIMHRALSWYGTFLRNRHSGAGYVFQNRYGSKVVDSDSYWDAIVAYVNLNPLEAKMVSGLDGLEHFPWSGYAALMGRQAPLSVHPVADVLSRLGNTPESARRNLLQLMREQVDDNGAVMPPPALREVLRAQVVATSDSDAGRSTFDSGNALEWEAAVVTIAERASVSVEELRQRVYRRDVTAARAALVYYGVTRLGLTATEAGRRLGMSQPASSRAFRKGRRQLHALGPEWVGNEVGEIDLAG